MPVLDDDTRRQLAQHLGMKEREVVAAAAVSHPDGQAAVVETHDGQRVLIAPDGAVSGWDGPLPADTAKTEPAAAAPDGDEVPEGTAQTVLAWVGTDPARATRALETERAGQGRSTLIANLEKLAAQA